MCCFSQGAALAVSYLLYLARGELQLPEELQRHGGPDGQQPKPPFRKAIFICGGVPLAALDDLGLPVSARAWHINDVTSALLRKKAGALMTMAADPDQYIKGQPRQGLWDDVSDLLHDPKVLPERDDVFGLDYTQFPKDAKVTIPTLHIYGAKDPRWPAAVQLSYFCENPITYDHGGGHEIPRSTEVSNKIAELITTLLTKD